MFKKIIEQRNRLAVFTTVILILQSILVPTNWMGEPRTVLAATDKLWDFNNSADYTPSNDANVSIFDYDGSGDGVAHSKATWTTTSYGAGFAIDADVLNMERDSAGVLWATTSVGKVYKSNDNGANWSNDDMDLAIAKAYKVIEATNGTPQVDLMAIGESGGGSGAFAYSSDGGATWNAGITGTVPGAVSPIPSITYDDTNDIAYAVDNAGVIYKSSNAGFIWNGTDAQPGLAMTGTDILWTSGTTIVAIGSSGGNGKLTFTTNGGTSWTTGSVAGNHATFYRAFYTSGRIYLGGQDDSSDAFMAVNDLSGGGTMDDINDWTDRTANLPTDANYVRDFTTFGGVLYAFFATATNAMLADTLDNGGHWFTHDYATTSPGDGKSGAVTSNGTTLLVANDMVGAGTTDVWAAVWSTAATSMVTVSPISSDGVKSITALAASYHTNNNGSIKISFGATSNDAGTFYYYDTGSNAWVSSSDDDSAKANSLSEPTAQRLATLPLTLDNGGSGTIYVKFYFVPSGGATILDNFTVTYDAGGGPGSSQDKTAPSSEVNALDAYSSAPDLCNPVLTVTATASDTGGSRVANVTLYMREAGSSFVQFGDPDTSQPYEWSVPVQDGITYYFYTIAVDTALPPNTESPPVGLDGDTSTTIDVTSPWFVNSNPYNNEVDVSINRPITIIFSEPIKPDTFQVEVSSGDTNFVQDLQFSWSNDQTTVTVNHPALQYLTQYFVNVTVAQDRAGNDWQDLINCFAGKGGGYYVSRPIPQFYFTTQKPMDPDLLLSHLILEDKLYHPNDLAEYTLYLNNSSIYGGDNVTVNIRFATGISFVEALDARFRTIEEGGKVVGLEWNGSIPGLNDPGHIIESKFVMRVDTPANSLTISQTGTVDDGVNDVFTMAPPAVMKIARHPIFDQSSNKAVDKDEARHGDVLFYTITIKNTGTTVADVAFSDYIPREDNPDGRPLFFFKPGSEGWNENDQRWEEVPNYDNDTQTLHGVARNVLPNSPSLTITFEATVRGGVYDTYIINEARVWDPNMDPALPPATTLTAKTHIPGGPPPPLRVAYQSPTPFDDNIALKQNIEIGFNTEVDLSEPFNIYLSVNGEDLNLEDWLPSWSSWNEVPNSGKLTLFPPDGQLEMGATYEIAIESAANVDGGELENAPKVWSFTTAAPVIDITTPVEPVYEARTNDYGKLFTIALSDEISGKAYRAEEDVTIGLTSTYVKNHLLRESGSFYQETTDIAGNKIKTKLAKDQLGISKITIPQGASTAYFYYFDTQVTGSDVLKVNAFDYPDNGWVDAYKFVTVVDDQPPRSLTITAPDKVTAGQYSSPITVRATDETGRPMAIPVGRLYLHTDGADGMFYDADHEPLPILEDDNTLSIQSVGAPQYVDIGAHTNSLTLFYKSNQVGAETLVISDNESPNLEPDINLNDAMAILSITKPTEEDLLLELEEVEDDTGRTVDHIDLTPTTASLLPNGKQEFTAVAYDAEDKVITGLKFKWFALITKSGTIEKNGHSDSSKSTFTASANLGTYYDDVMVATLYNGKIGYATATVKIVDVVNIKGPKHLPITGMNGLQLVLLALTLAAAVALAWVEHYDKTHFKPKSNDA